MAHISNVVKAGLGYVICNFVSKGAVFLTIPIFTRIMSVEDVGVFSNLLSWQNILTVMLTLDLSASVTLAYLDFKHRLDEYLSSITILGSIITLLCYIVVICMMDTFSKWFSIPPYAMHLLFWNMLVSPASQILLTKYRVQLFYKQTIYFTLVITILPIISQFILIFALSDPLKGRIWGYFTPHIILNLITYIYILHKGRYFSIQDCKYAVQICLPMLFHLLAMQIMNSSDKVMITYFLGVEKNALYTIPAYIGMAIHTLWISLNNAWSPWAMQKMQDKEYASLKSASKPYLLLFLWISCALMFLSPDILWILGGEEYVASKYIVPPIIAGYAFQFMYSFYVNIEFYFKKQKQIAAGTMVAATINICLNLVFIPQFGYIAAAYTTLVSLIILFFMHFILVKNMGYANVYDHRFFFTAMCVLLLIMLVVQLLYTLYIIRYMLFGVWVLFGAVVARKKYHVLKHTH